MGLSYDLWENMQLVDGWLIGYLFFILAAIWGIQCHTQAPERVRKTRIMETSSSCPGKDTLRG